jgi:hypothetical protein
VKLRLLVSAAVPVVTLFLPASAQATLGSLLYANPVGQGIRLTIVTTGVPNGLTLRPEEGEVNRLRKLVLALAGPERFPAGTSQVLAEPVPVAWTVDQRSGGTLIQAGQVTYWRYRPGQVLPVRFLFEGKVWKLQSAQLPMQNFATHP